MKNTITILEALGSIKTCKQFIYNGETIDKVDYDNAKTFKYDNIEVDGIHELYEVLKYLEKQSQQFIIRGTPSQDLDIKEGDIVNRRKKTEATQDGCFVENTSGTNWMMIDFDKIPTPPDTKPLELNDSGTPNGIAYLVSLLPQEFQEASFVYQWSSSMGIYGWSNISAHIWFWSDKALLDSEVYEWATVLKKEYLVPVDPRPFLTVQPNYTAKPIFTGMNDPLGAGRSGLVQKAKDEVSVVLLKQATQTYTTTKIGNTTYVVGKSFQDHIDAIGGAEGFYEPITKAIAHYCSVMGTTADKDHLKQALRDKWNSIPTGGRSYDAYMGDTALEISIKGAMDKFGQHTPIDLDDVKLKLQGLRKYDEVKSIDLGDGESTLCVNLIDAECGSGKTHHMLNKMANDGGLWIYACDKTKSIEERNNEFRDKHCKSSTFYTYQIYSTMDDTEETVCRRISETIATINKYNTKDAVIFITHTALFLLDWKEKAEGFRLVIDEANDPIKMFYRNYEYSKDKFLEYFDLNDRGECYSVVANIKGQLLWESKEFDTSNSHLESLLSAYHATSSKLWLEKEGWDEDAKCLKFFTVLLPQVLEGFDEVWMMGDEIKKSSIVRGWSHVYGVQFKEVTFKKRDRLMPLSQRVNVHYFTEHSMASKRFFEGPKAPLKHIVAWMKDNFDSKHIPYIYTNNEHFKAVVSTLEGTQIPPKAHGRNDLQHHTNCLWLAVMKVSHPEARLIESVFGMSYEEQVEWREHNALFQFIMRIAIRNYNDTSSCNIYVVDKKQAEYIVGRIGGTMTYIPNVIPDDIAKDKGGRPTKVDIKTMTPEEKTEWERKRKAEARAKKKAENGEKKCPKNPIYMGEHSGIWDKSNTNIHMSQIPHKKNIELMGHIDIDTNDNISNKKSLLMSKINKLRD